MDYVGTAVTLVDVTLLQAYYKSKYDGLAAGLAHEEAEMGGAHGRTINDKIQWLHMMTARPLICRTGFEAFARLRRLRNHLAHFDPPIFACTVDDVARWLNCLGPVALLLIKARLHLGCGVPEALIDLLLVRDVVVVRRDPTKPDFPQSHDAGYQSSVWPGGRSESVGITVSSAVKQRLNKLLLTIDEKAPGKRTLEDLWHVCIQEGMGVLEKMQYAELIERSRRRTRR